MSDETKKKKKKKRGLTAEEKRLAEIEYQKSRRRAYVGLYEKLHSDTAESARAAEEAVLMQKYPELVSPPPPVVPEEEAAAAAAAAAAPAPAAKPAGKGGKKKA